MAQRKNRKSGRFTKSTRRRSKPKTNLTKIAVSGLVANSITQGMFNTNLLEFVTGNTNPARAGGDWGTDGSTVLSLPELLGINRKGVNVAFGGNYGSGYDLQSVLVKNFKENWGQIAMGVILIPIVANVVTKVIRKPIILPANRMLKSIGMKDVKV
jgi:hypothetical protein